MQSNPAKVDAENAAKAAADKAAAQTEANALTRLETLKTTANAIESAPPPPKKETENNKRTPDFLPNTDGSNFSTSANKKNTAILFGGSRHTRLLK